MFRKSIVKDVMWFGENRVSIIHPALPIRSAYVALEGCGLPKVEVLRGKHRFRAACKWCAQVIWVNCWDRREVSCWVCFKRQRALVHADRAADLEVARLGAGGWLTHDEVTPEQDVPYSGLPDVLNDMEPRQVHEWPIRVGHASPRERRKVWIDLYGWST